MMTKHSEKSAAELVGEKKAQVKDEAATELAIETVKEEAKADTGTTPDPDAPVVEQYFGSDEIMMWSHIPELGLEAFTAAIAEDAEHPIPENKIAGIYKLERNGKNRTPYVQALRKRLGLKKGEDVPGAGGPDYTNDVSAVSAL
jgi:hypothetical protein